MLLTGTLTWPDLRVYYDEARHTIVLEYGNEEEFAAGSLAVPLYDAYVLQGQLSRAVHQCEHDQ